MVVLFMMLAETVHIKRNECPFITRPKVMDTCPEIECKTSIFGSLHATMR